ncbi:MAG: hypothetical protein ACRCTQ_00595 [Brevinemataceae bacterium]
MIHFFLLILYILFNVDSFSKSIEIKRYQELMILKTNSTHISSIWYDHKKQIYFTNSSKIDTNSTTIFHLSNITDMKYILTIRSNSIRRFHPPSNYTKDKNNWKYNVRKHVLKAQSLIPVSTNKHGTVIEGLWYDHYLGIYTTNTNVQIDHFIPRKHAFDSGGEKWSNQRKKQFVNCLNMPPLLIVTSAIENNIKSSSPPSTYMPPNPKFQALYVEIWIALKTKWNLKIDPNEVIISKNCYKKNLL